MQLQTPEDKLKFLVSQGNLGVEAALNWIKKDKLPYQIIQLSPDTWELRSIYTQGELYLNQFITVDKEMLELKKDASLMSKTPYEVLVQGESGVGKELISCSQIDDRKGQLKVVNCSGLPRELIESELFGHVKDSFTGANKTKNGLISEADDGVMFLDEIGDLPMEAQAKLLRAIQYKVIRKVGANTEEQITCKFVCATNKNLKKMVENGLFREDLYARLSTLELHITPLRDRLCDVEPICNSIEGGKEFYGKFGQQIMEGLLGLPLNVRSLQQYIIRYNVLGRVKGMK